MELWCLECLNLKISLRKWQKTSWETAEHHRSVLWPLEGFWKTCFNLYGHILKSQPRFDITAHIWVSRLHAQIAHRHSCQVCFQDHWGFLIEKYSIILSILEKKNIYTLYLMEGYNMIKYNFYEYSGGQGGHAVHRKYPWIKFKSDQPKMIENSCIFPLKSKE